MADEAVIRGINWRDAFPFTHLFRAFRVAVHPSKLVLGLIALLALYVGGRFLDGIWSPRSLAVPSEVYLYQEMVTTGKTSDDFVRERAARRAEIESEYADRLINDNVVSEPTMAREAAADGELLGKLKDKIVGRRNQAARDFKSEYDRNWNEAASITDKRELKRVRDRITDQHRQHTQAVFAAANAELQDAKLVRGVGLFHALFSYQAERVNGVIKGVARWNWLADEKDPRGPGVVTSVINFFRIGPVWLMRHHPAYFVLFTLWFLTIWAIFGGAIARIAAIHLARDEKLSVRAALSFSLGKFLSFVSAPLIPLVIVLFVGLVPLIAGLLSSLPLVGPVFLILTGAIFVLILAAGFVMTLVLLGTFGGFNLMYPTIAVEGSDSFDAISRSFSYVYARPWRMLFYTVVSIIYGALCYLFVRLFLWLMLTLTHSFVGAGMFKRAESLGYLWTAIWPGPQARGTLSYDVDFLTLRWDQDLAAVLIAFWVYLVVSMLGAFVISFYFTANTIIYYLMRNEVDATEMDDVYLAQSDDDLGDTGTPIPTAPASAIISETTTVTTIMPPPSSMDADKSTPPDKTEPPPS